jgi:hypothetical protein
MNLLPVISDACFFAVFIWLAYLAIEPYARRRWPDSFISWNRVLSGRLRDSLVASHVLAGFAAYLAVVLIRYLVRISVSAPLTTPDFFTMMSLSSATFFVMNLMSAVTIGPLNGMLLVVLVVLLRLLLRREWIADLLTVVLSSYQVALNPERLDPYRFAVVWAASLLYFYAGLWLLRRFGLVALMAMFLANGLAVAAPFISFTAWYAGRMLVVDAIFVAIAAWSFWVILSARRGTVSAPA